MFSGRGVLITRAGHQLPLSYEYVVTAESGRIGHLVCDTPAIDPVMFAYLMRLRCEGGVEMDVIVTQLSDLGLGFVGKCIATDHHSEAEASQGVRPVSVPLAGGDQQPRPA